MNVIELYKTIKGVFKFPKLEIYFGKRNFGFPYIDPNNFLGSIIIFKKLIKKSKSEIDKINKSKPWLKDNNELYFSNLPYFRRNVYWIINIFNCYYYIEIGFPIHIGFLNLGWKNKWDIPVVEWIPMFQINFFNWQFCILFKSPNGNDSRYYEMILWYRNYSNFDIEKAKNTWPWVKTERGEKVSSWDINNLIQKE